MALDPALDAVLTRLDADRRRRRVVLSTSADRAAEVLREQVVEGLLRSGSRLPEEPLAKALGVSRNTLREALSQLVAERILTREPYRGVVVSTPGPDDVADVYRARLVLEPAAVLAGRAHDDERLAAVRDAVAEGRDAEDRQDWVGVGSANQHFHRAIVGLAGSTRLDAQMDLLLAEMRLFFNQMARPEDFHRPYLDENAAIADLLARGARTEAAERLVAYLERAERQLTGALAAR
jgi:DNA-binding GntR family transcriptional regulator